MTPLDSSHLEVFLGIFLFFNSNLNFEFGLVWYRPKPEPGRTGLTGKSVPTGFVNPGCTRPSMRVLPHSSRPPVGTLPWRHRAAFVHPRALPTPVGEVGQDVQSHRRVPRGFEAEISSSFSSCISFPAFFFLSARSRTLPFQFPPPFLLPVSPSQTSACRSMSSRPLFLLLSNSCALT